MALTLPTTAELYAFWGDNADTTDPDRANTMLQLSSNLLWLATGLEDDPTDSRLQMLVQYAICDMAIYLYIARDDLDATYSPFNSERIGSYSYSKSYSRAAKAVSAADETGVTFFDKVVAYLVEQAMYAGVGSMSSESVFHTGYEPLWVQSMGLTRTFGDPNSNMNTRAAWYAYFGNADDDEGYYGHYV